MTLKVLFSLIMLFSLLTFQVTAQHKSTHNFIDQAGTQSGNTDAWQKLHIVYYRYFSQSKSSLHGDHDGCVRSLQIIKGRKNIAALKCTEHLFLLVSEKTAGEWLSIQKHLGYFYLSAISFGIHGAHAHILNTGPLNNPRNCLHFRSGKSGMVTGIFERHVLDAREYLIKNSQTHTITPLIVTPDHLFYVVNRHRFLPVNNISAGDVLITRDGHHAGLVCQDRRKNHCGTPWHIGQIKRVYNMAIQGKHQYFAGRDGLLVHNVCALAQYLQREAPATVHTRRDFKKYTYLRLRTDEEVDTAHALLVTYRPAYANNTLVILNCHALLTAALLSKKSLKIETLERYLQALSSDIVTGQGLSRTRMYQNELIGSLGDQIFLKKNSNLNNSPPIAHGFLKARAPALVVLSDGLRVIQEDEKRGLLINGITAPGPHGIETVWVDFHQDRLEREFEWRGWRIESVTDLLKELF